MDVPTNGMLRCTSAAALNAPFEAGGHVALCLLSVEPMLRGASENELHGEHESQLDETCAIGT